MEVNDKHQVTGLVFERYEMNLAQAVDRGIIFDTEQRFQDIQLAILHLHAQKLIHCGVKTENIFLNTNSNPQRFVLGDSNSVHHEDSGLGLKTGTMYWVPPDEYTQGCATTQIDYYSIEMLRSWLEVKCHTPGGKRVYTGEILEQARERLRGGA